MDVRGCLSCLHMARSESKHTHALCHTDRHGHGKATAVLPTEAGKSMKTLMLVVAILPAVIVPTLVLAQTVPNSTGAYVITQGTIDRTPVTILLNTLTGKTWFLGEVDAAGHVWAALPVGQSGSSMWIPLPFAPQAPPSAPR